MANGPIISAFETVKENDMIFWTGFVYLNFHLSRYKNKARSKVHLFTSPIYDKKR